MHRQFVDERGQSWHVWETRPSNDGANVSERYRRGWLAFETVGTAGPESVQRLRVAPIPEGWNDTTDEALCRLLSVAVPAPPRRIDAQGQIPRIGAP